VEKAMAVARGLNQGPSVKEAEAQQRSDEALVCYTLQGGDG
jgi:hypothetical protein